MEGDVHKHLKKLSLYWVKEKCVDLVANEVEFHNAYSIADTVGINLKRREIRVIECKATKADFLRDKKLFEGKTSYFNHAHYSYIMCPTDIIQPEEIPQGYGLLYVDEYDKIEIIKKPIKNTGRLKTMFDTTLKRTCRSLTNQMLFKEENRENKDETNGKFSRNSKIQLISVKCPHCKKTIRELISKNYNGNIKCSNCKGEFDLSKCKIREITGFNQKFINTINKINGTKE